MTAQYAFTFDAKFCSGCKACQAACKDKNNLPAGVLWRRVYEVSGGTWQQGGKAWNNTVFAYNLSMSCNHCEHPKCAGVCPVDAYYIREDGIVILDSTQCVGCGYCAWACPYGAPQYNPQAGYMTKCDFCIDRLEQGSPPACVAACPLRVLDYGTTENENGLPLWNIPPEKHPFPLSTNSHTQPHLAIQPHPAMNRNGHKMVANLEEIQPRIPSTWEEAPLMLFTLLSQLAVGSFWVMSMMFLPLWTSFSQGTTFLRLVPNILIGACLGVGTFASFAHLGTKKNAWRVLTHIRRSWLSREILFTGLFGLGWILSTVQFIIRGRINIELLALTSALGLGLVYSMSQVYRIPAAPGWNSWRTNASFIFSSILLGLSAMKVAVGYTTQVAGLNVPPFHWSMINIGILSLLIAQLTIIRTRILDLFYIKLRVGLIGFGIALTILELLNFSPPNTFGFIIFMIIVTEETLGRWLFYRSRV